MRAIARALIVPLAVIGVAAQAMLPTSPVASAQPYETAAAEPNVTPAISLRQLGLPDKLEIIGSNQAFDTSIPVPEGIGPSMLTGQIGSVVNVIDGRVDVWTPAVSCSAASSYPWESRLCRSLWTSQARW